jgi:radical SAM protein (TIGR01212 family)
MEEIEYYGGKRYNTWNGHLRTKFGKKVMKIALNGGFTCPNIDGKKGYGGCTYCSSSGSGDFAGDPAHSILNQFEEVKSRMLKKWHEGLYMPYFQAHTNTYAPASVLRERFEPVLQKDGVVGISIATRADCLENDVLEYLSELNGRTYLIVELGLQSIFDSTGERINRCHTYAEFLEGYNKLADRGINVCIHLINGLPGEDKDMMLESAKTVAALRPHCLKLHLLHVIRGTRMERELLEDRVGLMSLEDYVDIIVRQLEVIHPRTVIQRLTGDGARADLVGPMWSLKKFEVLNAIDRELEKRDTYQGKKADKKSCCF